MHTRAASGVLGRGACRVGTSASVCCHRSPLAQPSTKPRLPQIAQTVRPSAARLQARAPAAAQEVGAIRTAAAVKLSVTAFTDIASFSLGEKTIGSFRKLPGVVSTNIGYADSPDHVNIFKRRNCSSVLSGDGSSIVVRVEYDPTQITYTELLQAFKTQHDPSKLPAKRTDADQKFASRIYVHTPLQLATATTWLADFKRADERKAHPEITEAAVGLWRFDLAEDWVQELHRTASRKSFQEGCQDVSRSITASHAPLQAVPPPSPGPSKATKKRRQAAKPLQAEALAMPDSAATSVALDESAADSLAESAAEALGQQLSDSPAISLDEPAALLEALADAEPQPLDAFAPTVSQPPASEPAISDAPTADDAPAADHLLAAAAADLLTAAADLPTAEELGAAQQAVQASQATAPAAAPPSSVPKLPASIKPRDTASKAGTQSEPQDRAAPPLAGKPQRRPAQSVHNPWELPAAQSQPQQQQRSTPRASSSRGDSAFEWDVPAEQPASSNGAASSRTSDPIGTPPQQPATPQAQLDPSLQQDAVPPPAGPPPVVPPSAVPQAAAPPPVDAVPPLTSPPPAVPPPVILPAATSQPPASLQPPVSSAQQPAAAQQPPAPQPPVIPVGPSLIKQVEELIPKQHRPHARAPKPVTASKGKKPHRPVHTNGKPTHSAPAPLSALASQLLEPVPSSDMSALHQEHDGLQQQAKDAAAAVVAEDIAAEAAASGAEAELLEAVVDEVLSEGQAVGSSAQPRRFRVSESKSLSTW